MKLSIYSSVTLFVAFTACVDQPAVSMAQSVACTLEIDPPRSGLVEVSLRWICPVTRLASGNWVISFANNGLVEIGGLFACGSTSVAFVPSSGFQILASGDISVGDSDPIPCASGEP
jgi:hypothetical protein